MPEGKYLKGGAMEKDDQDKEKTQMPAVWGEELNRRVFDSPQRDILLQQLVNRLSSLDTSRRSISQSNC